ncbi:MAG: hydrogenase expression/formation protein HypE [Gemmatimonadota bacterium]
MSATLDPVAGAGSGAPAPTIASTGLTCPVPVATHAHVVLGHGSGGKLSARLFAERFWPRFGNPILGQQADAALLEVAAGTLAMSTDTFVVRPLEFTGGNIGDLAVNGTVNDLAMMGAEPRWLTCGFVLEEGLPLEVLDRVLEAMAAAARATGVTIVAGDTKVVERGKGDGIFINTTGIGMRRAGWAPAPDRIRPGDVVIASGPIGRHGTAILAARDDLGLVTTVTSDTAALWPLVDALHGACGDAVRALRDPTRGGVASTTNELAKSSGVGFRLDEASVPVPPDVRAACEMLRLVPMYVANEWVLVAVVAPEAAAAALAALRSHPLGAQAARIGAAIADHPGMVTMRTHVGGTRVVDMLPGDQLPRIC